MATTPSTFSRRYAPQVINQAVVPTNGGTTATADPQEVDNGGAFSNYYFPNNIPYNSFSSGVWQPDANTDDPGGMLAQDRAIAYKQGGAIDQQISDRIAQQQSDEEYFKRAGMDAYADILGGNGGYRPDESAAIQQTDALNNLKYTDQDAAALQLTPEEQQAILGDPNKAGLWFNPAQLDATQKDAATFMRAQLNQGNQALRDTANNAAVAQRAAIDDDKLRASDTAAADSMKALGASDAAVRGAIDPTALRQSSDFVNRYRMSDADVKDLTDQAARGVGNQYSAAETKLIMDANAAGNTSPLALGAARERLMRDSAVDSTDALTKARIAAKAEQAQREQAIEQERLAAEQGYSDRAAGAEMQLGSRQANQITQNEATRLGAEQTLAGLKAGTEQAIANQNLGVEDTAQSRGLATETAIGNAAQDTARYIGETGYGITKATDDTASNRAGAVATNRQGATAQGQANKFNNNMAVAQTQSGNAATVANARRADEQEARGFLTGQQQLASNNTNAGINSRISNYGTMTGATGDASKANAGYQAEKDKSGWGSVFKGAVSNALSSAGKAAAGKYIG